MARPDSWFRFYNTAVDNPKVQRLADGLFKVWVNLLCIASKHGGALPALADTAFALRVRESVVQGWLDALTARGLLDRGDDGRLMPHDWNDLQYRSDASKDRMQKYRGRHKGRHGDGHEAVTGDANDGIAVTPDETAQEQSRTEQSKEDSPKPPEGVGDSPNDFDEFWQAYPEKIGKNAAVEVWKKAKDKPVLASILAAVELYKRTKPVDRAWVAPARWLREGRWSDVPAALQAAGASEGAAGGRNAQQWRWGAKLFAEKKYWPPSFGPAPGLAGCECPPEILQEFRLNASAFTA